MYQNYPLALSIVISKYLKVSEQYFLNMITISMAEPGGAEEAPPPIDSDRLCFVGLLYQNALK